MFRIIPRRLPAFFLVCAAGLLGVPSRTSATQAPVPTACVVQRAGAAPATPRTIDYAAIAGAVRIDTLPEDGPHAVLGLRSVALLEKNRRLVVDSRQRRVTLRDADFRTLTVVGREGEGPGEYRAPTFGTVGPDGRIWIVDLALGKLSVFSRDGRFQRVVPRVPQNVGHLVVVNDTTVLVLGAVPGRTGYTMATLMTDRGSVLWQKVPAPSVLAATKLISDGVWGTRTPDGHAVVGLGISPEFVRVNLATGTVTCSGRLPTSTWTQLDPATRPPGGLVETRRWLERSSVVQSGHALQDGRIIIATERGTADGDFENDWIVVGRDFAPELRVRNVVGRLLLVRADTAWVTSEADDGRVTVLRVPLAFKPVRK